MEFLFICRANVGRSQMAPAFFNRMTKKNHGSGAGTDVGGHEGEPLHEFVIRCMAELGYDLSRNTRRQLSQEMVKKADRIIVMTEKESLPGYAKSSKKLIFWDIKDAKDRNYEFHCQTRDQIKNLVEKLVENYG